MWSAAVSCSPDAYRLRWGRIWDLVDGHAGPCMGWCMGGGLDGYDEEVVGVV